MTSILRRGVGSQSGGGGGGGGSKVKLKCYRT